MDDIPGYSNPTCEKCGLCHGCSTPFMPPNRMADDTSPKQDCILVIGEAPGRNEDMDGIAFHPDGEAGKLIRKELRRHKLANDVVFTNACICRPKDNKLTSKTPVKLCRKFLFANIEDLRPRAILILGNKPLYSLIGREGITNKRRQVLYHTLQDGTQIPMMAGFHPAYALYDMNNLPAFRKDIETFADMLSGKTKDPVAVEEALLGSFNGNVSAKDIHRFHKKLLNDPDIVMAFDAETNSLSPYLKGKDFRVTMLSFSDGKETLVARLDNVIGCIEDRNKPLLSACLELLRDKRIRKIAHNGKYDMHAVWVRFKALVPNIAADTMLLHALLHPINTSHALEDLSTDLLGVTAYHNKTKKKKTDEQWLRMADDEDLVRRAGLDAACTHRLFEILWAEAQKENEVFAALERPGYPITDVFNGITMPCMYTLFRMEREGFPVDLAIAQKLEAEYRDKIAGVGTLIRGMKRVQSYVERLRGEYMVSPKAVKTESLRITRAAEIEFNPASAKQVAAILYMHYKIPKDLFNITKAGDISADEETFTKIKESKHYTRCKKFLKRILRYRHLTKGRSTYITGIVSRMALDGRVHCTYRMDVARTGRLSSTSPNLTNITRKHMDLRAMYVAPSGWKILEGDYSQIELRVLAAESGDKTLVASYVEDRDLHDETARDVWKIPKDQTVSDEIRTAAKRCTFGIVYLISSYGLRKQIGGTEAECQTRINGVYRRFPGVKRWQNKTIRFAGEHGRVYSLFGHWRDVKNASSKPTSGDSEGWAAYKGATRQAVNAPIQGAAGFAMFAAMNKLDREIRRRKWLDRARIVNTVHDSLMLLVKDEHVQEVAQVMRNILESEPVRWLGDSLRGVPIKVDLKIGRTWATMGKLAT